MTLKRSSSSLAGDDRFPDGLGVDPGPLDLFDPLGFADDIDGFARRRTVEIKHGRITMMAFVGMAVQELGITSLGLLILQEITHSLMFSKMVLALLPSQMPHCLDLPRL